MIAKRILMGAALAGMVAGVAAAPQVAHAEDAPCYGINKCKGTGECGGKGHGCAGENECAGQGWIKLDKEKCLKIKGGSLEAPKD